MIRITCWRIHNHNTFWRIHVNCDARIGSSLSYFGLGLYYQNNTTM
jgi:hypothetical protein